MLLHAEPAFVLHRRPYRERDLWLELWTRTHGKLPVIAHRVRSAARQSELVPYAELRVWTRGRSEMPSLQEWELVGQRQALTGKHALTGLYLNELLYRALPRGEPEVQLFDQYSVLLDLLHQVDSNRDPNEAAVSPALQAIESALRRLELALLACLGYGLRLAMTHDGQAVVATARYSVDLESGVRLFADAPWSGELLLSLATLQRSGDPPPAQSIELRREQRRLLRTLLQQMLGDRPLASWEMVRGCGPGKTAGIEQ